MPKGTCVACGKSTRRKPNALRPCCSKCEKTAPVAMSAPALFTKGPAALLAREAEKQAVPKLPDPDEMNDKRVEWMERVVETFSGETGQSIEDDGYFEIVGDLLADIGHYCDQRGLDLPALMRRAAFHYAEETENQGKQFREIE